MKYFIYLFFVSLLSTFSLYAYTQSAYMTMPMVKTQVQTQSVAAMKMAVAAKQLVKCPFLLMDEKTLDNQEYIDGLLERLPQEDKEKIAEIKRRLAAEPQEDLNTRPIRIEVPYGINKLDFAKAVAQDMGLPFFRVNGAYFFADPFVETDEDVYAKICNEIIPLLKKHDHIALIINLSDISGDCNKQKVTEIFKFFGQLGNKHIVTLVTARPAITMKFLIEKGLIPADYRDKNIGDDEKEALLSFILQNKIATKVIDQSLIEYLVKHSDEFPYNNFVKLALAVRSFVKSNNGVKMDIRDMRQLINRYEPYRPVVIPASTPVVAYSHEQNDGWTTLTSKKVIIVCGVLSGTGLVAKIYLNREHARQKNKKVSSALIK